MGLLLVLLNPLEINISDSDIVLIVLYDDDMLNCHGLQLKSIKKSVRRLAFGKLYQHGNATTPSRDRTSCNRRMREDSTYF